MNTASDLPLRVKSYTLGPFATNCYLLWIDGGTDAWIVDASFGPGRIIKDVQALGLKPSKLILTHTHVDHIAGVEETLRALRPAGTQLPALLVHPDEQQWLADPMLNLSAMSGPPVTTRSPDALMRDGDELFLGESGRGLSFKVMHTPGHSPGGVSLYCASHGLVIAGDTLFAGSIGRTDFPGGDLPTLERSIRTKLYRLPPETTVLSGHGPSTTVADEMRSNPYVRA